MNKIEIGLRKNLVVCDTNYEVDNRRLVALVNHQLMQMGYMLSDIAFMKMSRMDTLDITNWSKIAIDYYKSYIGDASFKTLSELVLDGDLFDTHMSLLSRFWEAQEWEPTNRDVYGYEPKDCKILNWVDEKNFQNIYTGFLQVTTPLTEKDFEIIEWFVDNYKELPIPDSIPLKENLCMLAAKRIPVPVKTSTDVLRIIAYMSGLGTDLILPPKRVKESAWSGKMIPNPEYINAKFRKFSRPEKRYLLGLLDKVANVAEIKTREGRWLKAFNALNPQDYQKDYPKAFRAAYLLRNQSTNKQLSKSAEKNGFKRNARIITWEGKLNRAYKESFLDGLKVHKERAGMFARSLDALLRNNPKYTSEILTSFKDVAVKISNKVLFELMTHFENRTQTNSRTVFIPGARKPVALPTLPPMDIDLIDEVKDTIWAVLFEKFKELEDLGKVWIDEKLKDIPLPTNMKTLEDSLDIIIRGTRTPFDKDVKMVNAYMYWTMGVDIDLSMRFISEKSDLSPTVCNFISYNPLKGVHHSGDIIPHRPGKYAEYIGVDIDKVVEQGYRFGLMTVEVFRGTNLAEAGAIAGFQEVDVIKGSETWLPTNAMFSTKFKSKTEYTACILFDFLERDWILVDVDLRGIPVEQAKPLSDYIKSLALPPAVSVYDLLKMHADARGGLVAEIEDADIIYDFKDFSTSYEKITKFML